MKYGVVEGVKCNTLRWFGHIERMTEVEMTTRVYMSMVDVVSVRGRPPVKWGNSARVCKRKGRLEYARQECTDRNKWRLLSWPSPNRGSY